MGPKGTENGEKPEGKIDQKYPSYTPNESVWPRRFAQLARDDLRLPVGPRRGPASWRPGEAPGQASPGDPGLQVPRGGIGGATML